MSQKSRFCESENVSDRAEPPIRFPRRIRDLGPKQHSPKGGGCTEREVAALGRLLRHRYVADMSVLALLVTGWCLSGAICAWLATTRGRDGYDWALLGCLAGIFAIAVLLWLPAVDGGSQQPWRPSAFGDDTDVS